MSLGAIDDGAAATGVASERQRLRGAAAAFEALFVQSLLRRMRDAQLDEGFFGAGAGAEIYEGLFETHLSEAVAARSPLGIAKLLLEQWGDGREDGAEIDLALREIETARAGRAYASAVASAAAGVPALPAGVERAALAVRGPASPEGTISRPFGWGRDPIDGRRRFHGGVDLPAPLGTSVVAVAPGRVARVGYHGGYGLEILVEHLDGWTTRYAHLSEADVVAGQAVGRGQTLGQVGSTGRSTGPHLHFEALRHGRKVDPAVAAPGPIAAQVLGTAADE